MRKLFILLNSVSLFATGTTAAVISTNLPKQTENILTTQENKQKIINQNLNNLKTIDTKIVKSALIQKNNNVTLNAKTFENKNLTPEFIELIKEFKLENTSVNKAKEMLFESKIITNKISVQNYIFGWQISARSPEAWYDWLIGNWHLEFNHKLTQDIISVETSTAWVIQQFKEISKYIPAIGSILDSATSIIQKIIDLSKNALETNDKGNGIDIEFYAWLIPWEVSSSNHNW